MGQKQSADSQDHMKRGYSVSLLFGLIEWEVIYRGGNDLGRGHLFAICDKMTEQQFALLSENETA